MAENNEEHIVDDNNDPVSSEEEEEEEDDDDDDDDLGLEGVLIRNPDASSSSSSEEDSDDEEVDMKPPPAKSQKNDAKDTASASNKKQNNNNKKKKEKSKEKTKGQPEIINVEFTFHDFNEKYFHGVKALLHGCSTVYQQHSSELADLMIDNVSVGTICSTEGDVDGNVFGFGSVLNLTAYRNEPCIQYLKKLCLDHCPKAHHKELDTVLSGTTARPAGFFFHSRMVNLPLEIVQVLQQQLVLDMDWAVEHANGGEEERKSLNFGAFVRLAPATAAQENSSSGDRSIYYKYFDDEIFASHAEFTYVMDAPPHYGSEEKPLVSVIVMTKTGHRAGMKSLQQFVGTS